MNTTNPQPTVDVIVSRGRSVMGCEIVIPGFEGSPPVTTERSYTEFQELRLSADEAAHLIAAGFVHLPGEAHGAVDVTGPMERDDIQGKHPQPVRPREQPQPRVVAG